MAAGLFTSLAISLDRARRHEFWPPWLFYAPLIPYAALLALRARSATAFTACNPAIENAGGWVGERKSTIMQSLGESPLALRTILIAPNHDAAARTAAALSIAAQHAIPLPFILKPDAGERGYSVRLIRSKPDAHTYFMGVTIPVVLQPYHPGPCECGILWVRHTARTRTHHTASTGAIFSITRKEFPVIEGDGVRTLEQLILAHPRFRLQHRVFLERWKGNAERVLAKGERLRLAMSGNHCQGTLFRDGADLITPELSSVIDDVCSNFGASTGSPAGLDFCRIDIRYESDDLLRKGGGFAIVELNGTSAESTNLYDPSRSVFWAYSVLFAQWKHLYRLGRERMNYGARPITLRAFISMVRAHSATRTASPLAD